MVVSSDLGRWFHATDGIELGDWQSPDGKCPPATALQAFMFVRTRRVGPSTVRAGTIQSSSRLVNPRLISTSTSYRRSHSLFAQPWQPDED